MDGTDFRIKEPHPFHKSWYSDKFNGPAVKYEVGVCIQTGWIVWLLGPFRGSKNDHAISMEYLEHVLDDGERYIADKGYHSSSALQPYNALTFEERHYMRVVRGHTRLSTGCSSDSGPLEIHSRETIPSMDCLCMLLHRLYRLESCLERYSPLPLTLKWNHSGSILQNDRSSGFDTCRLALFSLDRSTVN